MESTGLTGKAKRVRIYVSEGDLHGHQPIDAALVAFLRKEGAAGATVMRAIEGFGSSGKIHTLRWVEVAERLPIVIEWIETAAQVERLLPRIQDIVKRGLITVEDTEVVLCRAYPTRDVSPELQAADIMSREVVSVAPSASMSEIVKLVLGKHYRALPVVEAGIPVGIITNSDLLERGRLSMRVELLQAVDTTELQAELERLAREAKSATEVMTPKPVTVRASAPLTQVAETMAHRRLKRMPVVDERGAMVGMVSRVDILRTAARTFPRSDSTPPPTTWFAGDPDRATAALAMRTDIPTVFPDMHLPEVLQAVISTRLNRCLVVDQERHVLGKITDAEVLDRLTPALRPSVLRSLVHRLPFVHPKLDAAQTEQHAQARIAADLMVPTASVAETAPLRQAIADMLGGNHKIVAVVDQDRRLVGVLDRADLLCGLVPRQNRT